MNIGAIPSYAFPTVEYAITASQSAGSQSTRASLPVSPSSAIYAHFKHVSGVPAPDGVSGVNINKLKIIDTLIEQLSKLKRQEEVAAEEVKQDEEKRINTLIDSYHNQIRTIQASNANNPYAPAASFTGALFSISV